MSETFVQVRQETRLVIRQRTGILLDKLVVGTATGGSPTSVSLEAIKRYPDESFAGRTAAIVQGTGVGQSRIIVDSNQQDGVVFVSPSWATSPGAGSVVEIWTEDMTPERVNEAINLAILDAQEVVQVPVRVHPVSVSSDRLELELPDELVKVSGLLYRQAGGSFFQYEEVGADWTREAPRGYTLLGRTLYVSPAVPAEVPASELWIAGYKLLEVMDTDDDLSELPSEFLVYMAAYLLDAGEAASPVVDTAQHGPRSANWLRQALLIRDRMATAFAPNTVEVGF